MTEKKRKFEAESVAPSSLKLEPRPTREENLDVGRNADRLTRTHKPGLPFTRDLVLRLIDRLMQD